MKQQLLQNLKKDTSGKWVRVEDAEQLLDAAIEQSIVAVKSTGTQCAYTTHDLIAVKCTIDQCGDALKKHFGIE